MQICLQALCWELLFCSHIFFIVVFPTLFVLQAYCICVYFSLFSLFVQLIHDQCAYYLTCFNYCMQLENRTEQSRTEYWNRVRISQAAKLQSWSGSSTESQLELWGFPSLPQGHISREDLYWNGVLNLHLPAEGSFRLLTVPPCSPLTQHGLSGSGGQEHKSFELNEAEPKWPQKSRTEQKEQRRSRKRRRENNGAEQREGDGSRAQRPSSELPVCLHSRAAAASTSVAPSGSPPSHPPPPLLPRSPSLPPFSCLFIYLWFPSTTREPAGTQNKDGGYRGRNGWREGKRRGGGGGWTKGLFLARVGSTHVV